MATLTISLPEPLKDWVDTRVRDGAYSSPSDYLQELVHRDQGERELTLDELRQLVSDAKASGISDRSVDEIAAEARATARLPN